jgi:hypothetical protein
MRRCVIFLLLAGTLLAHAPAQNANQTARPSVSNPADSNPAVPTVTFDCFWELGTPQSYTITVQSAGGAKYVSSNPRKPADSNGAQDEDYAVEFTISAANRDKIFHLAEEAGYFNGNFDFRKHAVANTGKKTLTYADPARQFHTTYNWSENTAIDQLTRLFQGISNTVEYGRRLQFRRRFDKLGLEAELKGMETMAQGQNLAELQAIGPLLKSIAEDSAILNIARQRARRLLAKSSAE